MKTTGSVSIAAYACWRATLLAGTCLALWAAGAAWAEPMHAIAIDGDFADWASVTSYTDPVNDEHDTDHNLQNDTPVHVDHDDVDLVEFKFAHDYRNAYAYFRSTGVIGRTQLPSQGPAGRYYVIVTMDVDGNNATGYWLHEGGYYPTTSGYDMNMEVEFYGGTFNTGNYLNHGCLDETELLAAIDDQINGIVDVRPGTYDWYTQWIYRDVPVGSPEEFILPNGAAIIFVWDRGDVYDSIVQIAVSPDGHEAEMVAPFRGFLNYPNGSPIMACGKTIDLSFSLEASGELAAGGEWASDTANPINGYYMARPELDAVSDQFQADATAGSTDLAFEVDLDAPIAWQASVVEGDAWLSITSPTQGTGGGALSVAWQANAGCEPRTATVRIASEESENGQVDFTVTQAANATPDLTVTPSSTNVGSPGDTLDFDVAATGCADLGWQASVIDGDAWATISGSSQGSGSGTLAVTCAQNFTCIERSATVRVSLDDAQDLYTDITITQDGSSEPAFEITPQNQAAAAEGGTVLFDVANISCGELNWQAEVIEGGSWAEITGGAQGSETGTVAITCSENTDCAARPATIRLTSIDFPTVTADMTLTQAGSTVPMLSAAPEARSFSAGGETLAFAVTNIGCGVLNWQAATESAWFTFETSASASGSGTIEVTCDPNPDSNPRSGTIAVTAEGIAGSPITLTVDQDACADLAWSGQVSASDGGYSSKVQVAWDSVPDAASYRVYRGTQNNPALAQPLGDWQEESVYDDYSAAAPPPSENCLPSDEYSAYFYWVKARNDCGRESGFSGADEGHRGATSWCSPMHEIVIDGAFDDWAEVVSHEDPEDDQHDTDHSGRYDTPFHVDHEDADLVEYKFTHDAENLYAYFRSRGIIGRTQTADQGRAGRFYVIVTIDVDNNDTTGYWLHEGGYYPTSRGYDMNMEVEFYDGAFNTGNYLNHGCLNEDEYMAALDDQADGVVDVRPGTYNWYTQWVWFDEWQGYPGEILLPNGASILWVEDRGAEYEGGIIDIAVSEDGHEAEMVAPFRGFMNYPDGRPIMALGNVIDVSFSLEASGELAGGGEWASDTAAPIARYFLSRPIISVEPLQIDAGVAAGSDTLDVSVSSNANIAWQASVAEGGDWLEIAEGAQGEGNGTITIAWNANGTCGPRSATLLVSATDAENYQTEVTVAQAGDAVSVLSVTPTTQSVEQNGGTLVFDVSNLGCEAFSWLATSDSSWITVTSGATGTDTGTIEVTCDANAEGTPRTGTVHVTASGAIGSPIELTIDQSVCPAIAWAGEIAASSGDFTDYVRVTWDAVPGAAEYRIYRGATDDSAAAQPLGDWQTATTYDDATANAPTTSGCTPATQFATYFYWVKARSDCGSETDFSASSEGYRGDASQGTARAISNAANNAPRTTTDKSAFAPLLAIAALAIPRRRVKKWGQ